MSRDKPRQLLLIDPAESYRNSIRTELEKKDFVVFDAPSGPDAFQYLNHSLPEVIMIDILAPQINGVDLAQKFRENDETHDTPILMFASPEQRLLHPHIETLGIDDFLSKPFKIEELALRVTILCRNQALITDLLEKNDSLHYSLKEIKIGTSDMMEKEKKRLIKNIHEILDEEMTPSLLTILEKSQSLQHHLLENSIDKKINSEIINSTHRLYDIILNLSKMTEIVTDDYIKGTKMINLHKSLQQQKVNG